MQRLSGKRQPRALSRVEFSFIALKSNSFKAMKDVHQDPYPVPLSNGDIWQFPLAKRLDQQ